MGPLAMMALGAGAGYLKNQLVDKPNEERERQLQAEIARWSPWTGISPTPVRRSNVGADMMQGGFTGLMMGQQGAAAPAAAAPSGGASLAGSEVAQAVPGKGMNMYSPSVYPTQQVYPTVSQQPLAPAGTFTPNPWLGAR